MKEQKKKIQLLLEEHFSQYGFKRKKLNNYIRIKDGNVIQDIGFTTTTHGERHVIYLNPVLGVIYKDVDEIMVQLREGTNSCLEMYTPMISLPIGYLMPDNDFKEWKFTIDKDVNEDVDNMARAYPIMLCHIGNNVVHYFNKSLEIIKVLKRIFF